MLQTYWYGLGVLALIMTMTWLHLEDSEKVYFTAGIGGTAWLLMSLTARGLERLTETGTTVPADAGVLIQLFTGIMALLSLLVVVLYKSELYPPPGDDAPDDKRINT